MGVDVRDATIDINTRYARIYGFTLAEIPPGYNLVAFRKAETSRDWVSETLTQRKYWK